MIGFLLDTNAWESCFFDAAESPPMTVDLADAQLIDRLVESSGKRGQ